MPHSTKLHPHDRDPERAQLIQTYMVLHAKQTSVRRRLSTTSVSPPGSPLSSSPAPSSPVLAASLPTPSRRQSTTDSHSPARPRRAPFLRRPSVPSIPELPEQEADVDCDEGKLVEIGARIRSTLMDLLVCASVQDDVRMRDWVQTRLDDALRSGGTDPWSRRSSVSPAAFAMTPASSAAAERWRARRSSSGLSSPGVVPAYESTVDREGALDDGVRKMSL